MHKPAIAYLQQKWEQSALNSNMPANEKSYFVFPAFPYYFIAKDDKPLTAACGTLDKIYPTLTVKNEPSSYRAGIIQVCVIWIVKKKALQSLI